MAGLPQGPVLSKSNVVNRRDRPHWSGNAEKDR
jgi:hypothetical protein